MFGANSQQERCSKQDFDIGKRVEERRKKKSGKVGAVREGLYPSCYESIVEIVKRVTPFAVEFP